MHLCTLPFVDSSMAWQSFIVAKLWLNYRVRCVSIDVLLTSESSIGTETDQAL